MQVTKDENRLNKEAPHQAVILVRAEIMERLPTGEISGLPCAKDSKILTCFGKDFQECQDRVEKFLEQLPTKIT